MKTIGLAVLVSFLGLAGLSLASQSEEEQARPSMMEETMKHGNQGEHMDGMRRMMKMMDQCAAMMESASESNSQESQKQ